ncbi:hypothetical protein PsYK624_085320 [Phanerochaete sordida]|uniref:C2H2-type domain-containing protein n=1 Tax=Phanerochaete sordida TaxID=48140 RepID=A0A9P3GCI5_9APHY|nr:hypothetical protein PsYK624_085320 [Phanerochaete sordida]
MVLSRASTCDTVTGSVAKLSTKENVAPADATPESISATRTTRSKARSTAVLQEEQTEATVSSASEPLSTSNESPSSASKGKGKAKATAATKKKASSTSKKARGSKSRSGAKGQAKEACPFKSDGCEGRFVSTNHDVRRHMEIHTYAWQKALYCARYHPDCAYTAVQDSNFRTHIRHHHSRGAKSSSPTCRALLQRAGPDGKPWVCNHPCTGGSPLSHWRTVHGTTEPEVFNGTWFDAYFCSMDDYFQFHGHAPPLNCKEGHAFRDQPVRHPKADIDKLIEGYGGRGGWSLEQHDVWIQKEIGYSGRVFDREGRADVLAPVDEKVNRDEEEEEEVDELLDDSPTFYMDGCDDELDTDETIEDEAFPIFPREQAYEYTSWPPPPPPAGYTGSWDDFPKACVHHKLFHQHWLVEGHTPEASYEIRKTAYNLLRAQLAASETPDALLEDVPSLLGPASVPTMSTMSWDVQSQPAPAQEPYNEFAWAMYPSQSAAPSYVAQGYHAPPSTPYFQPYFSGEVPLPTSASFYGASYSGYASGTVAGPTAGPSYPQYQYPATTASSQWPSAYSSVEPSRQASPAHSDDERAAAEALLGLKEK